MKEFKNLLKKLEKNEKRIRKQAKKVDKICQDMDALTMRLLNSRQDK